MLLPLFIFMLTVAADGPLHTCVPAISDTLQNVHGFTSRSYRDMNNILPYISNELLSTNYQKAKAKILEIGCGNGHVINAT